MLFSNLVFNPLILSCFVLQSVSNLPIGDNPMNVDSVIFAVTASIRKIKKFQLNFFLQFCL